jgi:hypothetical protein
MVGAGDATMNLMNEIPGLMNQCGINKPKELCEQEGCYPRTVFPLNIRRIEDLK